MAEYIDRKALIAEFKRLTLGKNSIIERIFADGVYSVIETFPAADVAHVVRCKDCKYWTKQKDSAQGRCDLFGNYPTGGWYCANGERKDGAGNG